MYIVIVSRGYPSKRYGQNGIFEYEQARALAAAGHKVILAALDVRSIRRWRRWGFESLQKDGVLIEVLNAPCGRIPPRAMDVLCPIFLKLLYRRIEKKYGRPDLIHTHFIFNGYYVTKALNNENIPLVLTEHYSALYNILDNKYLYQVCKYTYPRFDKIIAVSPILSEILNKNFNIESVVIPNMVNASAFAYTKKNEERSDFTFATVSNLTENKRTLLLVEAFCEAFECRDNVKLVIIGSGPQKRKIDEAINNYDRGNQIMMKGSLNQEQIASYIKASDCFVLVSRKETFGLVLAEAMMVGVPVIATKSGGPQSFVNQDNGLLIPVDDAKALKDALRYMHQNACRYDGQLISSNVMEKFSPKIIADLLLEQYGALIDLRQ